MAEFVALADRIKGYPQKDHKIPEHNVEFAFDSIAYTGISEGNIDLVKSRVNIQTNTLYTVDEVIEGIDRAMGTSMLDQIVFRSFKEEEKLGLQLIGFERTPAILKGSLHYDTERGVGLLVNVTGRNILEKASRSLITLDIAEDPRLRLQHQKYFGNQKKWWWRSEVFGQQLDQKIYINGLKADDMRSRFFQVDNQLNKNLNSLKSYIGAGINYEYVYAKPEVDPDIHDNLLSLKKYHFHNLELNVRYVFNNMNQVFYPTYGSRFQAKLGRSLIHQAEIEYSQDTIPNVAGTTNGFTRLSLDYEKRIFFKKNISCIVRATTGFTFVENLESGDLSFLDFGFGANYYIGGLLERQRKENYVFRGMREVEFIVSQFMMINLGFQFNPFKSIYFTPHVNLATVGYDNFMDYMKDAFSPGGSWPDEIETSGIISAGVTVSYKSILGPVDLDVSWINDINKIRVFFGLGYQFNRSN